MTSRGLARGVVHSQLTVKLPCVIIGDSFPSWLAFASQLGYEPVAVVLRSQKFLSTVEASIPESCVVWSFADWTALVARAPRLAGRSAVTFVDGRVTQEVLDLSEIMCVHTVVGTARSRSVKGWHQCTQTVQHAEVGGVTNTCSTIVACHFRGSTDLVPQPSVSASVTRDLSSVLSDVVAGGFPRNPPALQHVEASVVVNVRPQAQQPVFHGKGWLPSKPRLNTWVLTPSVFTEGDKWTMRPLTTGEYLAVYDCPDRLVGRLEPLLSDAHFPGLQPGKALIAGAALALRRLRPLVMRGNEGGGYSSFPTSAASTASSLSVSVPAVASTASTSSAAGSSSTFDPTVRKRRESLKKEEDTIPAERCKRIRLSHPPIVLSSEQESILEQVDRDKRERKATKADDAEVPVYVWTEHYIEESTLDWKNEDKSRIEKGMDIMRKWLLLRWKRRVFHSYLKWFYVDGNRSKDMTTSRWLKCVKRNGRTYYEWSECGKASYRRWHKKRLNCDPLELEAGSDAVCRAWLSSWWEWEDGSRPFHWRWPEWYRTTIRDGLDVYLDGDPPRYTVPQRDEKDPAIKEGIKKKLFKVRTRRYIGRGSVVSLTSFFAVPKGESDIRMVYDGTKSGLNASMWVPRFALPTVDTHLRSIEEGTFLADVDVGECFLNFPLHRSLRRLAGVDFTHYFPDPKGAPVWECWHRALMGCKSSPYQAVQGMTAAEEVIRGDPSDDENVFRWDHVRLNCPGDEHYDSSKPWVSKVRKDGAIAADLVGYVDDLRTSGPSRKEAWHAARRTASVLNHLGIQDAPRKRRDSTRTPGAWSGSVVVTRDDGVYVTADTEKWNKAKGMITEVLEMIHTNSRSLNRKRLEEIRGFLNYVVRTYPPLKSYLTGLHLTIDGWRSNRDEEGWRMKETNEDGDDWLDHDWTCDYVGETLQDFSALHLNEAMQVPTSVSAKPRLEEDMKALQYLMKGSQPLPRKVRSKIGKTVVYCFGDASSSGFGFTLEINGKVYYEYGQWGDVADDKSSNWREATNLLASLKRAVVDHKLNGLELFIFTDNTTAESTFWKGWSKNKLLSDVVLEMRKLEMENDLILHVIHVSGSRMIRQGTDGLSRADHSNGVMNGERMIQHIPLNLTAFERSPQLLNRFISSFKPLNFQILEPKEWFDEHHRFGNFIWCPPPAATDAAVDLLNKARHKRPESFHIVLVPRLMTGRWRRMLTRSSDFYFRIDWKDSWDLEVHHEPVLCFVCLPFSLSQPNLSERQKLLDDMGRLLLQPELRKKSDGDKPFKIRKFLDDDGVELEDKENSRFVKARPGDMFMVPFQCEVCHFRNIQKRNPMEGDLKDMEVLEYIRRASLDSFWARESSTVAKSLSGLYRAHQCFDRLGLNSSTSQLGPYPLDDSFGMLPAIAVLDKSLDKGIYEEFVQWETFRKIRSSFTNFHQASALGLEDAILSYERTHLWVSKVPTHSFWFIRFMEGLHKRVGEVVKQDWPIPIEVMQFIDRRLNRLWREETDPAALKTIAEMGAWFVMGFCIGLRGEEMILIELNGTANSLKFLTDKVEPHFLVRIKGRTKAYQIQGKGFEIPCVAVTGVSRLKPGRWIRRLVGVIHAEGRQHGKLFQRRLTVPRLIEFEEDFYQILESVQNVSDLIDPTIDLREKAGILRSIRCGLTSHAVNMRVEEPLTNAINRWRSEFKANGTKTTYRTIDHYAQLDTLKPTYLAFSKAL